MGLSSGNRCMGTQSVATVNICLMGTGPGAPHYWICEADAWAADGWRRHAALAGGRERTLQNRADALTHTDTLLNLSEKKNTATLE